MSGTEWDDEDDDASAPLPPHERTWRHPSELGPLVVAGRSSGPVFGRAALIGAGVVSLALVAGLIQLLLPQSGTNVSSEGTQSLTSRTSAFSAGPTLSINTVGARLTTTTSQHPVVTPARATTAAPRRTSSAAATIATNSVSTILVAGKRAAVPIGDGRRAVTTAESLSKNDTIDVTLGDGTSVNATVVSVDLDANVAVLALDQPIDGAPTAMADGNAQSGDQVTIGCSDPTPAVLVQTDDGMTLDVDAPVDEGAPVLDEDGALLGLASTSDDGLVHLVSIPDGAATPEPEPDPAQPEVWMGVNFGKDGGLVVIGVQPDSPAATAGVLPGDQLLAIDDTPLASVDDLWTALNGYQAGDVVTVAVQRDAAMLTLTLTLADRPS